MQYYGAGGQTHGYQGHCHHRCHVPHRVTHPFVLNAAVPCAHATVPAAQPRPQTPSLQQASQEPWYNEAMTTVGNSCLLTARPGVRTYNRGSRYKAQRNGCWVMHGGSHRKVQEEPARAVKAAQAGNCYVAHCNCHAKQNSVRSCLCACCVCSLRAAAAPVHTCAAQTMQRGKRNGTVATRHMQQHLPRYKGNMCSVHVAKHELSGLHMLNQGTLSSTALQPARQQDEGDAALISAADKCCKAGLYIEGSIEHLTYTPLATIHAHAPRPATHIMLHTVQHPNRVIQPVHTPPTIQQFTGDPIGYVHAWRLQQSCTCPPRRGLKGANSDMGVPTGPTQLT